LLLLLLALGTLLSWRIREYPRYTTLSGYMNNGAPYPVRNAPSPHPVLSGFPATKYPGSDPPKYRPNTPSFFPQYIK